MSMIKSPRCWGGCSLLPPAQHWVQGHHIQGTYLNVGRYFTYLPSPKTERVTDHGLKVPHNAALQAVAFEWSCPWSLGRKPRAPCSHLGPGSPMTPAQVALWGPLWFFPLHSNVLSVHKNPLPWASLRVSSPVLLSACTGWVPKQINGPCLPA